MIKQEPDYAGFWTVSLSGPPTTVLNRLPLGTQNTITQNFLRTSLVAQLVKNLPREGKGYPLQYSGLENSMDCIVHGIAKSWTQLSDFHFHFLSFEDLGGISAP